MTYEALNKDGVTKKYIQIRLEIYLQMYVMQSYNVLTKTSVNVATHPHSLSHMPVISNDSVI